MKVCFIVGAFPNMKCGIGDYTSTLSKKLSKEKVEVSVITSIDAKKSKEIEVYNIVKNWNHADKKNIISKLEEIKPDIVHIQYPSDEYKKNLMINFLPRAIKKSLHCKVVITIHEYDVFTVKGKIRNFINMFYADNIVVVENEYKKSIKNFLKPISKSFNISYIPISSSIGRYKLSATEYKNIRKKYKEKYLVSYFGFAIPSKGIENLLEAVSQLDDTRLLLICDLDEQNEYQKSLLELICNLNIEGKVSITGFIEDDKEVAKYLASSDLCVLPFVSGVSERNSSFLTAYNQNIKVLTTSLDEKKNMNGIFYCKPLDSKVLKSGIETALKNKDDFSRQELNWNNVIDDHIKLYNNILK